MIIDGLKVFKRAVNEMIVPLQIEEGHQLNCIYLTGIIIKKGKEK